MGIYRVDEDQWRTRAVVSELFSVSLRYPSSALAQVVISGEWAGAVLDLSGAGVLEASAEDLKHVAEDGNGKSVPDADELMHVLRTEATRLFEGPPQPVVTPYEGVWRAKREGKSPLLFVSVHSLEVEEFMRLCGFTAADEWKLPVDHIAVEFELLELLAARAAGMAAQGDDDGEDVFRSQETEAFLAFEQQHLAVWLPGFAEELEAGAQVPFYRVLGRILRRYCADKGKEMK